MVHIYIYIKHELNKRLHDKTKQKYWQTPALPLSLLVDTLWYQF